MKIPLIIAASISMFPGCGIPSKDNTPINTPFESTNIELLIQEVDLKLDGAGRFKIEKRVQF